MQTVIDRKVIVLSERKLSMSIQNCKNVHSRIEYSIEVFREIQEFSLKGKGDISNEQGERLPFLAMMRSG